MAKFNRLTVYNRALETVIVPVFYHSDIAVAKQVVKACYDGGIRLFEFTNRGDFAHEVFGELSKWVDTHCPELILGVGTVMDAGTASLYLQLGANFVVSPILNPEIFRVCNRRQVGYIPGCCTVTEVSTAQELGAEIVKLFPAGTIGGPSFVKNIKGPMPWSNIMVTGGVEPTVENIQGWLDAGVSCVGMGSKLFPKEVIETQKWDDITALATKLIQSIKR